MGFNRFPLCIGFNYNSLDPKANVEKGSEISYNHNKTPNKLRCGIFTTIYTYKR